MTLTDLTDAAAVRRRVIEAEDTAPDALDLGWTAVCPISRLTPIRGVAALVEGEAVAIFLLSTGDLFAIANVDPCSGASVLSRGIVGDADGVPTVASPLYKQRFDLRTGQCLEDPDARVQRYAVRVENGSVEVSRSPVPAERPA